MKLNWFALSLLSLSVGATALIAPPMHAAPAQGPGYGQNRGGWDAPPSEFRDIQRQGFHDGIEGARKDFGNHRRPDVNNREEYRRPRMPRRMWRDYQDGFRRGYSVGVSHLMGGRRY